MPVMYSGLDELQIVPFTFKELDVTIKLNSRLLLIDVKKYIYKYKKKKVDPELSKCSTGTDILVSASTFSLLQKLTNLQFKIFNVSQLIIYFL